MAVIYISPSGNDTTGAGTSGNPYLTVNKAYTVSSNGDTIHLLAGTYTWVAQTFAKQLTIEGDSELTTFIDGTSSSSKNTLKWLFTQPCTIQLLQFKNLAGNGVTIFDNESGGLVYMTRCIIHDITFGPSYDYGVGVWGSSVVVNGSISRMNACLIYAISSATTNVGVVFTATSGSGTMTNQIYNSIVYLTATGGARLLALCENIFNYGSYWTFKNSIIYNTGSTMYVNGYTSTQGYNLTNCDFSSSTITGGSPQSPTVNLTNCITSDPLFIDPTNALFRLRPTSPCRATGISI